jgi:hypothetical protein
VGETGRNTEQREEGEREGKRVGG